MSDTKRERAAAGIKYSLPDGRIVSLPADVARSASCLDFQLADGSMVTAVILPQREQEAQ